MPKLPPFALADVRPPRSHPQYLAVFFFLFAVPLFAIHLQLFDLPFFWDEHGQFIPTALDILRTGAWVTHSAVPNVHPPGVEAYLALLYKIFGFSIPLTRAAMLLWGSFGLLFTFLLAIELSQGAKGAPAFLPPLLLLASPLFYTQSMMAQLDMPAMVLTLLSLLLFFKKHYRVAALACVALVLVKETGLVVPAVLFAALGRRKQWSDAALFIAPGIALAAWLVVLHRATGHWLGDPGFVQYNVSYALHPVRLALCFVRRVYYLFFAEFRIIGTIILATTVFHLKAFRTEAWAITAAVGVSTFLLVTVLGGAELERYLLPVLPLFYIAIAIAFSTLSKRRYIAATAVLFAGLVTCLFWNPPYPFPYENNYAMVDFVHLQQLAADFASRNLKGRTIATAWPYTAALSSSDYGYVQHPLRVVETHDLHAASIRALRPESFDTLITYTRTWSPPDGVLASNLVRRFLSHFYDWEPEITPEQCEELGLHEVASWTLRGQGITIYRRGAATLTNKTIALAE